VNSLTLAKQVARGDASSSSAYIQGFRQFNEFGASVVRGAEEYRYLNSDPRRGTCLSTFLLKPHGYLFKINVHCHSTRELVQTKQVGCHLFGARLDITLLFS